MLAVRRRGAAALLVVVVVGELAYATWLNPMGTRDRQNGVFLALVASVLCGVALAEAARRLGRAAPFAAAALAVLVCVEPALHGVAARLGVARSEAPRAWAEAGLSSLPPRAVALLRSDDLAAGFFWLTLAEPVRPDVAALVRQHLWDSERTLAVAGVRTLREIRDRPIGWEIGDDALPGPARLDLPLALLGGQEIADAAPALRRVFDDVGDPETPEGGAPGVEQPVGVGVLARGSAGGGGRPPRRSIALGDDAGARANAARYFLALGKDGRAREHAVRAVALDSRRADGCAGASGDRGGARRPLCPGRRGVLARPGDRSRSAGRARQRPPALSLARRRRRGHRPGRAGGVDDVEAERLLVPGRGQRAERPAKARPPAAVVTSNLATAAVVPAAATPIVKVAAGTGSRPRRWRRGRTGR